MTGPSWLRQGLAECNIADSARYFVKCRAADCMSSSMRQLLVSEHIVLHKVTLADVATSAQARCVRLKH